MTITSIAESIGKGLVAGVVGTAAMTVSSTVEMKIRDRPSSAAPANAASTLLGIESFTDDAAQARFSNIVHWAYGTGWGGVRGLLASLGLPAPIATAGHLGAVWGSEQVLLPALEVAPPITQWGSEEVAVDLWHHLVYAVATGLAYNLLDGR